MTRRPLQYELTFSVTRLVTLLEAAGFEVRPPSGLRSGLVRFVATPAERDVYLESAPAPSEPFERATPEKSSEVEIVRPGQYL